MSTGTRIPLAEACAIADDVITQLSPHCSKLQIAGSIRRRRHTIGDIEIVCLPHAYEASPLFPTGIATVVNQWEKIKGELPCRYTQRLLPCGMKLDLFMPDPRGYGPQVAIRTGSADWCKKVLAPAWVRAGFRSKDGLLRREDGSVVPVHNERALFDLIGLKWVKPEDREVQP
jgi:DNA polymerase/3'-5' exonuclease PolX